MARIFISYKRADKDIVFPIKDRIEAAIGEKCWIDLDGIESDAQFVNVIMSAIEESTIFLFLYSKRHSQINDYDSDWTIRELSYAQSLGKRIVFVNIDNTPLSRWFAFMYGLKQQVDATSSDRLNKMIGDIKSWLKISPSTSTAISNPKPQPKPQQQAQQPRQHPQQPRPQQTTQTPLPASNRYSIRLVATGPNKLQVVKGIKESLNTGLKEAKDILDAAPCNFPGDYSLSDANKIKQLLEEYGATVSLQRVGLQTRQNSEQLYSVMLLSPGQNKLQIVKDIKEYLDLPLVKAKNIIDKAPSYLPGEFSSFSANQIKHDLEASGASVIIHPLHELINMHSNYYMVLPSYITQSEVLGAISRYTTISVDMLKQYTYYSPCLLPILLDGRKAQYLKDEARRFGSDICMIPYTSQTECAQIKILSLNNAKLQVVKFLKENLNLGLAEAKALVDNIPAIVAQTKEFEKGQWFADELRRIGAVVSLEFK